MLEVFYFFVRISLESIGIVRKTGKKKVTEMEWVELKRLGVGKCWKSDSSHSGKVHWKVMKSHGWNLKRCRSSVDRILIKFTSGILILQWCGKFVWLYTWRCLFRQLGCFSPCHFRFGRILGLRHLFLTWTVFRINSDGNTDLQKCGDCRELLLTLGNSTNQSARQLRVRLKSKGRR